LSKKYKYTRFLIIVNVFVIISLISCQNNPEIQAFDANKAFKLLQTYIIPDSLDGDLIPGPRDFEILSPNHIYLTTGNTRRILQTSPPLHEFKQIGRLGLGPGEYVNPWYITIDKQMLYYSDGSNMVIKSVRLPGGSLGQKRKTYVIPTTAARRNFAVRFPYLAVLNSSTPYVSLYKLEGNGQVKLLKKFLKFEDYYGIVTRHADGGGIVFDSSGTLYVVPVAPYVISSFRIQEVDDSLAVKRMRQFNLQASLHGNKYFISWSKKKYNHVMQLENRRRLKYLIGAATIVNHCWLIEHENQQALLVDFYTPMEKNKGMHFLHMLQIVSLRDGRIIHTYNSSMSVLGVSQGDVVYFYRSSIDPEFVKIFSYQWLGYN